jgi:hypothetical protein
MAGNEAALHQQLFDRITLPTTLSDVIAHRAADLRYGTRADHLANHHSFRSYAGRGITVCEEWRVDFWAWLQHIGRRPVDGLRLERIDNDKGYQPNNVCWDTAKAQHENRRPQTWPGGKTSKHRGVSWYARSNKWRVQIMVPGQGVLCLGYFPDQADAAICWNTHVAYLGLDQELNEIRTEDYYVSE